MKNENWNLVSLHHNLLVNKEQADLEYTDYLHQSLWKGGKEYVLRILEEQSKFYGFTYRIVREDDNAYVITRDLKPNRINLEFKNGYLEKSYLG